MSYVHTSRSKPADFSNPFEDTVADRLPPYDLSAEIALLGSMIIDPEVIADVCAIVTNPEMFFDERNQIFFNVILELNLEPDSKIDTLLISARLRRKNLFDSAGGLQYLSEVVNSVPSAAHANHYAGIVREKYALRQLIQACTKTLKDVYESGDDAKTILDRTEKKIFEISENKSIKEADKLDSAVKKTLAMIDRTSGTDLSGLATGFIELDNLTSGLQRGEMIVLAARPSVGKSALSTNIAEHVGIKLQRPVAIFSMEMPTELLTQRIICSQAGIDSFRFRKGKMYRDELERYQDCFESITAAPIHIDDTCNLTLADLRSKAKKLAQKFGIEMLVVDYLQLMEDADKKENRQQEISSISRGIKAIARELNVPIIVLSQLNRSNESEKRLPRASDLRESGAIEQDADVIMLLHREDMAHRGDDQWLQDNADKVNKAQLIIAKQRNGPCDIIKLSFEPCYTKFTTYNPGV